MSISTYQFAHNNPVWKIELEGLEGVETSGMDIPNGEPVRGHTNTGSMAIPIGDGTGNHGSAQRIITLSANISPSTEFRSGAFNDNDFVGNSVPATDAMYNTNPVGAVLKDVGYVLSNLTGVNAVDDAIAVANDPNSTKLDVAEAAVNVLMTGKGGKGKISKAGVTGHTKHGLNQSINRNGGRGVSAKAKASAIVNPKAKTEQSGGRTKYKGKKATVVTNSDGKIITTFGSSRSKISVPQGRSQGGGKAQRRNIKETGASYNPNQIR